MSGWTRNSESEKQGEYKLNDGIENDQKFKFSIKLNKTTGDDWRSRSRKIRRCKYVIEERHICAKANRTEIKGIEHDVRFRVCIVCGERWSREKETEWVKDGRTQMQIKIRLYDISALYLSAGHKWWVCNSSDTRYSKANFGDCVNLWAQISFE